MQTKVIIPAAGKSTRISEFLAGKHKCLTEYNGESVLFRLVRQIIQAGYTDITVVLGYQKELVKEALSLINGIRYIENTDYEKDKNIWSLLKGYPEINCPALIVESDIILSDACIPFLREVSGKKEVVWCTNGFFQPHQSGAIISTHDESRITEIKYVSAYDETYKNWHKNLGILLIPEQFAKSYRNLLQEYTTKSWQHYFIEPIMEHISDFPSVTMDFGYHRAGSFNTSAEFFALKGRLNDHRPQSKPRQIELIPVESLCHIEDFDNTRVEWLCNKIENEKIWRMPICIDRSIHAVMDGQHRMEAAKRLGLHKIPALVFDYNEVDVWTLRPGQHTVSAAEILHRAKSGDIYPYKTAKHEFHVQIPDCTIRLDELR